VRTRALLVVLEYGVAAAILYSLSRRDALDLDVLATIPAGLAVAGLAIVTVMVYLGSVRVKLLLRDQGIAISTARCFLFNCLSTFYSLLLPGGLSGDAARAYYLLREVEQRRAALLGSLILDRVLGLLAMIGLGTAASAVLAFIKPSLLAYFVQVLAVFLVGLAGAAALVFVELKPRPARTPNRAARAYELVRNLVARLDIPGHSKKTLAQALILSVAIHSLTIVLIYLCSTLAGAGLDLIGVFSVAPLGLLANAVPVSPGGLGVGEQAFELLYALVGGTNGASSFLTARFFIYSPALVGALVAAMLFLRLHRIAPLGKPGDTTR